MLKPSSIVIAQRLERNRTTLNRAGSYNASSPGVGIELRDHRDGDDLTPAKMIDRKHSHDDTLIAKRFEQESQIDTICLYIDNPNRYLGSPSWNSYNQNVIDDLNHFWTHHGHHVSFLCCSMQGVIKNDTIQNHMIQKQKPSWRSRLTTLWDYQITGSQKKMQTILDSIIDDNPHAFYCIRGDARLAPYFQKRLHPRQYVHFFINPSYYGGLIGSPLPSSAFSSSDHPLDSQTVR